MFAQATPVTTATGVYASISGTAASYLKDGVGTNNKQCIVIGTVRATYNGSAAGANDLNLTQSERNDKRVFIRPTPMYFSPVTSGAVAATTEVATHTALAQVHGSGEYGDFGSTGVLWQSYGGQIGSTTAGDNDKQFRMLRSAEDPENEDATEVRHSVIVVSNTNSFNQV